VFTYIGERPGSQGETGVAQRAGSVTGRGVRRVSEARPRSYRILVVEDQRLFAELLHALCTREFGHDVVATVGTVQEALAAMKRLRPELVLLDLSLPDGDGVDLAEQLFAEYPQSRIVALSSQVDEYTLHRVLESGIHGYVDKNEQSAAVLREAIETVMDGRVYFSSVISRVRDALRRDPRSFTKLLSAREQKLLELLGSGMSNAEVARELGIKPWTVHTYRRNISGKLGLHGTTEIIRYAWEKGFAKIERLRGRGR
jgi:DNA-binding NarL/FixJ family response regulator